MRKLLVDIHDEYLRMAVSVPDLPKSLTIMPASRARRIAGFLKGTRRSQLSPRKSLIVHYSSDAGRRAHEQSYLTRGRLEAFEELQEKTAGLHVWGGTVYVIQRFSDKRTIDIDYLFSSLLFWVERVRQFG